MGRRETPTRKIKDVKQRIRQGPNESSCSMDNISSMESEKQSCGGVLKREPRGNMSVVLVANVCQLGCIRCMRGFLLPFRWNKKEVAWQSREINVELKSR